MAGKLPTFWPEAVKHLTQGDRVLAGIIDKFPKVELRLKKDAFTTLARAIAGQQISVKAADTIWGRVVIAARGKPAKLDAKIVAGLAPETLRACGLSERKVLYMQGLAQKFANKEIAGSLLAKKSDAEVKARLTALLGIGPWTADMYLMFNLWRPDVLPLGDVGLIRAIELNYFRGRRTPLKRLVKVTEPWRPYATVATWYLWRSIDPVPVEY